MRKTWTESLRIGLWDSADKARDPDDVKDAHNKASRDDGSSDQQVISSALYDLQAELGPADCGMVEANLVEGEALESCLLRFLRARGFDIRKAATMLRNDIAWRREFGTSSLLTQTRGEVAGVHEDILWQNLPVWHQCFDKEDRPVIFKHYGKTNLDALLEHTTLEKLHRLHVYENEETVALCAEQSRRLGRDVSQAVFIIDAAGWNPKALRSTAAVKYAKQMACVDQDHYPERLARVVIINAPYVLSLFWKLLSVVVDAKTQRKVQILVDRQEWIPVLHSFIDPAQLPEDYGGTASPRLSDNSTGLSKSEGN